MSVLITGATGFIGNRLAKVLALRGESVRVLCRPTADVRLFVESNIRICRGDILDAASLEKAIDGCDRVFQLAAYARNWAKNPRTFIDINVGGLKNVLDAAQRASVKKVVFTSSALTLGPSNAGPVNESLVRTAGFFTEYEHSKFVAEQEVLQYVRDGLHVVIVNPSRVFGPGLLNEGNSVTKMIRWYLEGKWRFILGDGNAVGNYAFVDDVVQGHLLAMEYGRAGERYILGGDNVSFNKFFDLISEIAGRRYRLFHVPASVALTISTIEKLRAEWLRHYPLITPGWVKIFINDWGCSTEKTERELGYTPTPLREALEKTIAWLQEHNGNTTE